MNRKFKRSLSFLMSLVMVLSMFTGMKLLSFASDAEIVIDYPEEFSVGDIITVTVSGVNMEGLESADISFYYDTECFEFVKSETIGETYIVSCELSEAGHIYWTGVYYPAAAPENVDFTEITFKVLNTRASKIKTVCASSSGIELPAESIFEISVCEHNYEEQATVEPNCVKYGYTKYICTFCGNSYNDDYVEATDEHNYEATESVEPSCGDEGYTKYVCSYCGDSYYDYITATENHDYEVVEYVEATCLVDGHTLYKCNKCGDEYTSAESRHCVFESGNINCNYCGEYGFTYEISNGEVKIVYCYGDVSGEIAIPDEIENCPVTTIGYKAFDCCNKITKIIIPANITTIEDDVFKNCYNIEYIEVDEGNKYFSNDKYGVLFNKDKTQLIQYPAGRSAETYIVPDGVVLISSRTENNLSQNFNARDAWTPWGAFYGNDDLENLVIPSTVTAICDEESYSMVFEEYRDRTFDGCDNLRTVIIYSKNVNVYDQHLCVKVDYDIGGLVPIEDSVIYGYAGTVVEQYAKDNNITFIEISDDLISNMYYKIENGEVTIIGFNKSISGDIVIPDKIEGYPVTKMHASSYDEDNTNLEYCPMLTGITVPESVENIDGGFYGCYSLENINLGENLKKLCNFYGTGFAENDANWEDDLLYIGKYLVGVRCRNECTSVKDGTTVIADGIFSSATCSCKKIILPDGLKIIGKNSFSSCDALEEIVIPDSVTDIDSWAFNTCHNLKSVVLPKGITEIKEYTFNKCISLADVTIQEGVVEIGASAFKNCSDLKSIKIPESVTKIGSSAFMTCSSISEITISENMKDIGNNAFYKTAATKITVLSKDVEIGEHALGYTYSEKTSDGYALLDGVEIYGYTGSTAEAYAKENGITFILLEEPSTEEPTTEEPTTEEATTETPIADDKLEVKNEGGIVTDFENKLSVIDLGETADTVSSMIENEYFAIVDKNGNKLERNSAVGTGSRIQVLDKNGNSLNEYTIVVPTDVDGNGKTTAADARLALRAGAKIDVIDILCYFNAADFNGDGKITALDARSILRKAANLD